MNRRTFLKSLGIGAVGAALGTANYDKLLGGMPAGAPSGGDWGVGSAGSGAAKMLYRPIPHTGQQADGWPYGGDCAVPSRCYVQYGGRDGPYARPRGGEKGL